MRVLQVSRKCGCECFALLLPLLQSLSSCYSCAGLGGFHGFADQKRKTLRMETIELKLSSSQKTNKKAPKSDALIRNSSIGVSVWGLLEQWLREGRGGVAGCDEGHKIRA